MAINHRDIHQHTLYLSEESSDISCSICSEPVSLPYYVCVDCQYCLHESCIDFPRVIELSFHPHYLFLSKHEGEYACDSCHKCFHASPSNPHDYYQCWICNFDLDVKCALMPSIDVELDDYIQHFTHPHPLTLYTKDDSLEPKCFACKTHTSDPIYGCMPCDYFLHKPCAELPKHILHSSHPTHVLTLLVEFGKCDCCQISDYNFKFRCVDCQFSLDAKCVLMPAMIKEESQKLKDSCFMCNTPHPDPDYFCLPSQYYLNQSCLLLPEIEHPFHTHNPLKLYTSGYSFQCVCCHKNFDDNSSYRCDKCYLIMDIRCALMSHTQFQKQEHLQHPNHRHSFVLINMIDTEIGCLICEERCSSLVYACFECSYFLHESCSELPIKINHHFHPQHPLLLHFGFQLPYSCDSCHKSFTSASYRCTECNFYLDAKCVAMPLINNEGCDDIQHFSHQHPLVLYKGDIEFECFACKSQSSDQIYGCIPCEYFLHKSCALLPDTILHSKHPNHSLSLFVQFGECDYCHIDNHAFIFKCDHCFFSIHVTCALMSVPSDEANQKEKDLCFICNLPHSDQDFFCIPKEYYLTQSCVRLPKLIQHSFHTHRPLKISTRISFWCDSCHKEFSDSLSFNCDDCNFHMDTKCALMPHIECDGKNFIQHFSHQHPLVLLNNVRSDIDCFACNRRCTSQVYACVQCGYFIHQSCAELPREIRGHPFHDNDHSLIIRFDHRRYSCHCCHRSYQGFIFRCDPCDVNVGVECAFLRPTISYKHHKQHSLCFIQGFSSTLECDSLHSSCKYDLVSTEFKLTEPYMFHCKICNFNLHLLCGPLPCTIKHKCHIHALTLRDCIIEDDSDDEYYCDVCEEERDPRICVYYCKDCGFISHVHCVMDKVISALKQEPGEVELRLTGEWTFKEEKIEEENSILLSESETDSDTSTDYGKLDECLTLKDVLDSLTKGKRKMIESSFGVKLFEEDNGEQNEVEEVEIIEQDVADASDISPYDDEFYVEAQSRIGSYATKRKCLIESSKYPLEVIQVSGYMVPSYLAHILETLFVKHGNISRSSKLGRTGRSVVFYFVCWTINDMVRTCADDITEYQLSKWLQYLAGAAEAGFKLDFVKDHFSRVAQSHIGLQAIRHEKTFPVKLNQRIGELNQKIEELNQQISQLTAKSQRFEFNLMGPKSEKMQICLSDAKVLRWRTSLDFL